MKKGLIFDTRVWIDYLTGINNDESELLQSYIENDQHVYLCPTIILEVL